MNLFKTLIGVIAVCTLFLSACTRQKNVMLKINYIGTAEPFVHITLPIDGHYFEGNEQKYPLVNDSLYEGEFTIDKPGVITITNNFKPIYLYVKGGEQFDITVHDSDWTITGANAEGQKMYNNLLQNDSRERYVELSKFATIQERVTKCVELKNASLQQFTQLLTDKKITSEFDAFMQQETAAYYKLLLTTSIYFEYRVSQYPSADTKPVYNDEFKKVWEKELEGMSADHSPLLQSRFYPDLYIWYYALLEAENKIADAGKENFATLVYNIFTIEQYKKVLKGTTLEYVWATQMAAGIQNNRYEKEWVKNFADFKAAFPQSKLMPALTTLVKKVEDYHKSITTPNEKMKIVDNYDKLNSFAQVLNAVKGKMTYIDLWATWCSPCRDELQYSVINHHTMEKLGVQLLYISIDKAEADTKWKEMINGLHLQGLHVRTNQALTEDLNKTIPNFDGIPRYILVDASGKVVSWDAKRPSSQKELFEQIKQMKMM